MTNINPTKPLNGRIAVITGASRGIGAAVAKRFAAEGAHVVLLARTVGGLEETDDAIRADGGQATLLPIDLRKPNDIEKLGPALLERFGKVDILVANAAVLGALSPVAHSDLKMWQDVFSTNVMANVRLIRSLDPLLRASDAGRAIFVTSGIAGSDTPFWGAYAASKAALENIARTWAAEVKDTPLKVNILDPGVVRTTMRADAFPGENPDTLPPPENITQSFVDLATPDCTDHGIIREAAA